MEEYYNMLIILRPRKVILERFNPSFDSHPCEHSFHWGINLQKTLNNDMFSCFQVQFSTIIYQLP